MSPVNKSIFISSFLTLSSLIQAEENLNTDNLYNMNFEQLMDIEVVSVTKKSQTIRQTAAAIYVISQTDIQRSGATTLPEVLRGAPGVHVAHVDGNKWAISTRGFNDLYANKLLVLVDGRSVYTPLFSGVFWNMQDIPLSTIERVEIVRGSGGTLWGENAVNGVINIITKHSDKTQGTELSFLGGSKDLVANIVHGGKLTKEISYRAYVKGRKQDDFDNSKDNNTTANDNWKNIQSGFRLDGDNNWLLEGSYMRGAAESTLQDFDSTIPSFTIKNDNSKYQAAHILLRKEYQMDDVSKLQFQAYYDYHQRSLFLTENWVHTFDLDTQYQFQRNNTHSIILGAGYRGIKDKIENNSITTYSTEQKFSHIFSGFIQDEIQLNSDLFFTLGSKFSHNSFSGFEYQPSAKLLWAASSDHSFWGSVSYAVRTPTRSEQDIQINAGAAGSFIMTIDGNPDQKAENLTSFELGYRGALSKTLSFDASFFYNHYDDVRSVAIKNPVPPSFIFDNNVELDSIGVEIFSKWQIRDYWQLMASYSYLHLDARLKSGGTDLFSAVEIYENSDPAHQASLRSSWQLPLDLEFNTSVYYTSKINHYDVDDFTRLDLRLAWKPNNNFELSIVGQNILESQHKEFSSNIAGAFNTEVPRSVYAKIITRF